MPLWMDNSFFALVGLVFFIAILVYVGLPRIIGTMLDKQIAKIESDLSEAKKLREDAAALLVEYEQKRIAAEADAQSIIAAAQEEAIRLTAQAQASLADLVARRTKAVEDKIAQAEAQAIGEVRGRSADLAVEAARLVLTDEMNRRGGQVIDKAISDVSSKLN